jgi:ABC-type dipeptide/oligopeptide/nickel transport system permease component
MSEWPLTIVLIAAALVVGFVAGFIVGVLLGQRQ